MMVSAIVGTLLLGMTGQIDSQLDALRTLVIREDVSRYRAAGGGVQKIDTFETTVEVIDGAERYSGTTHNGREISGPDISGTWSFGELATLLRTTRDGIALPGLRTSPGHAVFHLPACSGRWFVRVDSRIYWLDITGEVSLSETGQLTAIRWTSNQLPVSTGVDHIVWTVTFRQSEVGGRLYLLPDVAEYRVIHCRKQSEWNVTRFEARGRYGSEFLIDYAR